MKFEYKTTFLPVNYKQDERGLLFKEKLPPSEPEISAERWNELLNEEGSNGWELVSTAALLKGIHAYPTASHAANGASSYSITAGFTLFWKREPAVN